MSLAICPAHGWWATYTDKQTGERIRIRLAFWESNDEGWLGIVDDAGLRNAEKVFEDPTIVFTGFDYEPVSYDKDDE